MLQHLKKSYHYFCSKNVFHLSSGCEIPPEAKPENVAAMVAAATRKG